MKKIFLVVVLISNLSAFAQDSYDFSKIARQYQENLKAQQAARDRILSNMSSPNMEVEVQLNRDLYDFTHIAVVSASCAATRYARDCFDNTIYKLKNSPLERIRTPYYNKKEFKKNNNYLRNIKDSNWLYVTYRETKQGYDYFRSITVRDFENNVIYKSKSINVPVEEVMSVLTDM